MAKLQRRAKLARMGNELCGAGVSLRYRRIDIRPLDGGHLLANGAFGDHGAIAGHKAAATRS
jgi:hypothetical protein